MKPLAFLCALALALLGAAAQAGPGHDHDAPAAPRAGGPQRLPDGSVFLPKPAQRQLAVRTVAVSGEALPRTVALQGQVLADPSAGGVVQPLQAGRLVAPPQGFPRLGQRVQRGEVLAYVEPAQGSLERSAQAAQMAELSAQQGLAQKRLARLQELADTVPRREIEAVEGELQGLRARLAALQQGVSSREALRAPVAGLIAMGTAVAGQVVDARDRVFEVVDPKRLRIEALAYEVALAQDVGAAFVDGKRLTFLGAAAALRDQALPLHFATTEPLPLAVGQPVRVLLQSRSTVQGHAVPAEALMRNPANQTIVWVKTAPERFAPRVVLTQPLDGARVVVTQGLQDGDRVVTQGATLVNQVR